ncbi:hypothetical protein [Saccharothrix sp.]|uniref:hypothetical protein n=1 Tax=Saccharothrix sp. TaxID=1873460 RepID=UPI002811871C|nr:hypothetical protein [Saccharothrix sp.]
MEKDVPPVRTPEEDQQLADSQKLIDDAKLTAEDLRKATPDPFPDSEPPQESRPGS